LVEQAQSDLMPMTKTAPTVTVMSAYLFSDAMRMIACAEKARTESGLVSQREEETFSRAALLLLAFAFEAFVNEQSQEDGVTEAQIEQELQKRRKELKKQKLLLKFPKTLLKFVLLCEKANQICPNFVSKPFDLLRDLFDHRNRLVHYSMKWEPSFRRQNGTVAPEARVYHFLEVARQMADCWYSSVACYFAWQGIEESVSGDHVGILTSYQRAYWRLLKRPVPSISRCQTDETLPGLATLAHEAVIPSWTRHKNRQTFVYWDRKRCFTILITAVNGMKIEHAGHRPVEHYVHLEVHPETATLPAAGHVREVPAVVGANLVSGFNELLPRVRQALVSTAQC
jgi:hypothetical protein